MMAHLIINQFKNFTMKKFLFVNILLLFAGLIANSQNYITRNGNISFYSHTPLEDIKAENNEAVSVLNTLTGVLEFKVAVKSFHFAKTAMEDHLIMTIIWLRENI